jgi:hypothetical protein
MFIRSLTIASLLLTGAVSLQARTFTLPAPVHLDRIINKTAEIEELTSAYITLAKADHDYKGHRAAAMRAIEKACDILGSDIREKGRHLEPQTLSDDQLKEARRQVAEVRDASKIAGQTDIHAPLEVAVAELDIALTIK